MAFADLVTRIDRAAQGFLGGSAVIYRSEFGAPVTVQGIFDASHVFVDEGEAGVESYGPAVFVRLSDLPVDPSADADTRVTIAGTEYRVIERKPDSMGGVMLRLHRVL